MSPGFCNEQLVCQYLVNEDASQKENQNDELI